ncbi:MAG: OB-fold domain-containing protein [Acidimicrobiales bacterium]
MSEDSSPPVLIGVGAAHQRITEPGGGLDTTALMADAVMAALADSGAAAATANVDWIGATRGLSGLPDAARRIAEALGVDAFTVAADVGIPQQTLVNRALEAIRSGRAKIAVVCGGETKFRDDTARRAGVELPGHDQTGLVPDLEMSPQGEIVARPEIEIGAVAPVQQYALIDSARRAAQGWTLDEHRDDIAALWHRFNRVAQTNPRADFGAPMSAEEIREPGPANRPIAFPYNKWHNSQWGVDQASAMVFCNVALADELGVDPERRVYPHVGLESSLSLSLSRRAELHRWPAMRVLGEAAAAHVGRPVASMDFVELYSCFPVAVRVQQQELGLDPDGTPTLTGGMAFAGGPFNNFVYQATVDMIEAVRSQPGSYGAVTAVSGLLTKPALAVWSTEPPERGLLIADLVDDARAATSEAPLDEDPAGDGVVATYTVVYAGNEPARVCAIVDLDSGERAVAAVDDPDLAATAVVEDLIGTRVRVDGRALRP